MNFNIKRSEILLLLPRPSVVGYSVAGNVAKVNLLLPDLITT